MTDKNYGIAVCWKSWYVEKCFNILNDMSSYSEINISDANKLIKAQCDLARTCGNLAVLNIPDDKQLDTFLISNITKDDQAPFIPNFKGLPKIHKMPRGMRPIIDCHFCLQGPAAKYVSKCLKPIITGTCNGSILVRYYQFLKLL